jgi:hypothetical protein
MAETGKHRPGSDSFAGSGAFGDSLSSQEHLDSLDKVLHELWRLGRNIILCWSPCKRGIDVLVIPFHLIAEVASGPGEAPKKATSGTQFMSEEYFEKLISGPKQVTSRKMGQIGRMLSHKPHHIDLPFVAGDDVGFKTIESLVRRFGISYVNDRAVALFDIVNFTLNPPLVQVTQLNSLAYSVNSAHSRMLSKEIDISFARTTTGDGFYIWNRDRSIQANVNLYHFMHLVLADNAIARSKSRNSTTPVLRACFNVGSHYEFYQSEGLSPTTYNYIVGDVTIELARMIESALPGQVCVGDFHVPMPDLVTNKVRKFNSLQFVEKTQETLSSLEGLTLSGDEIDSIKCYLTGERQRDGGFNIKRYRVSDKHGRTRDVFNAKINIYRKKGDAIFLGAQDHELAEYTAVERRQPKRRK